MVDRACKLELESVPEQLAQTRSVSSVNISEQTNTQVHHQK